MEKSLLAWQDVEELVSRMASQIRASNWQPDAVVGLARGGYIPAVMIAYRLGVRCMAGLSVTKDAHGVRSLGDLAQLGDLTGQNVLAVDDATITGRLLILAAEAIRAQGGLPRTCALITLGTGPQPDYVVDTYEAIPVLPWE